MARLGHQRRCGEPKERDSEVAPVCRTEGLGHSAVPVRLPILEPLVFRQSRHFQPQFAIRWRLGSCAHH